jgi:hypothetical protein
MPAFAIAWRAEALLRATAAWVVSAATAIKAADSRVNLLMVLSIRWREPDITRLLKDQVSAVARDISSRAFQLRASDDVECRRPKGRVNAPIKHHASIKSS